MVRILHTHRRANFASQIKNILFGGLSPKQPENDTLRIGTYSMRRRLLFSLLSSASLCTLLIAPALADNVSITATITGTAPNAQANATVAK